MSLNRKSGGARAEGSAVQRTFTGNVSIAALQIVLVAQISLLAVLPVNCSPIALLSPSSKDGPAP